MDLEKEFIDLSIKFLFVCEDNNELNLLLNDLNSLDYRFQKISNQNVILQFIESLTKIQTTSGNNVIVKTCNLLKQLLNKQKISLPEPLSNKIINWIIKTQSNKSSDIFVCEALDVLALLFKNNHRAALMNLDMMLANDGVLVCHLKMAISNQQQTIIVHDYTPQEIYRSILSCIESILMHLEEENDFEISYEYIDSIGKILIKFIYNFKQNEIHDNDFISIATLAINSLKFICQTSLDFSTDHLGELLGITKAFMMYGLNDNIFYQPVKVHSSQQPIMDLANNTSKNKKIIGLTTKSKKNSKLNASKKKSASAKSGSSKQNYEQDNFNSFSIYRTSDSDFSDNEHNRELINRNKQSKLRLTAHTLVLVLASNIEKKVIFGYWHCLLSADDTICNSLTNCILKDSSPRCKIVALQTIIQLLKNSKPYLLQAENKDKITSTFTPFSVTLGNMITFTYEKLTQAIIKEADLTVLTQILKCISIFITVTPFHRLKVGVVSGFVKYVRLLIRHKDPTIKVAALIIMENLISLQEITPEIYELVEIPKSRIEFNLKKIDESIRMVQPKDDDFIDLELDEDDDTNMEESMNKLDITSSKMSWLLQIVLENLGIFNGIFKTRSIAVSVRVQSLQVLTAMTSHFLLLKDHLLSISTALAKCFQDSPVDEKLYASRALESLGSAINNFLSQEKKTQTDADLCLAFWIRLIPNVIENIQNIKQSTNGLRASLADSLSNLGVHIFEKLDSMKQTQLKSILTGCSYDDDTNVKSSAVRALAVYVLFPSLREDICFIENTTESVLRIIKDQNFVARTKASFGLANIVDCLLIVKETISLNNNLLREIFETCLQMTNDNDRVKVNAVRTLGNSITLLKIDHFKRSDWIQIFEKSIEALNHQLINCSNVKVKWNICYAFSSIMKNVLIFEDKLRIKWQEKVFNTLCQIIETSPNFKVRTNACLALTTPNQRKLYDIHFTKIWTCLLVALEQSNNMTDFNEYRHRDALQDQLCTTICHFINFAMIDDVIQMKSCLIPLMDVTKQNWERVINRLPPEYQNNVLTACNNIKTLEQNCKNVEQKNSIEIIIACFQPVNQLF
ncbi:hypothetical protein PVAND_008122 [Polypedilum vanderplanki]|uniref:HEAT repeat-containing protein 6 n=1 Tax=Polypedilum vanderplanki TaxID=319348 RepID=A0A9J6C8T8_POLVA|nr:hypothetical protein PVAND_008122 [Polypedilum vanderplanki]